jgi:iron complex outermembrane receptor protein
VGASSFLALSSGLAQDGPEEIIVVGERVYPNVDVIAPAGEQVVETGQLLKRLPGTNLNANGGLTGIAQYRGLYGDRVAVSIDGLGTVTGGPNAMDAPLSYASPLLLEHLTLERGIASVSSATESLGGHISTEYDRGRHGNSADFSLTGAFNSRYESNGGVTSLAARLIGANDTQKIALLVQRDDADDLEYPDGKILPSQLGRERYDLSYAYRNGDTHAMVFAGRLDTNDSGTPALPMDIDFIETDTYGLRFGSAFGRSVIDIALSYSDVDHGMDNFSLRTPPPSMMGFRSTRAFGDGYQWRIGTQTPINGGELRIGLDGQTSSHTATITNPNVAPFQIANFNDAERDVVGLYGQWNQLIGNIDIELGMRVNRIELSSDEVSANIPAMNPMMQMMGMNAAMLADAFNAGDRSPSHTNVDAVFKIGRVLGDMRSIYLELAQKTRAPSYQEAFLWLPLQATGGLADGRSYIGNPELESEVSREINIGMNWRSANAWAAPQVFFKDIGDYIQGVPTTNITANGVANMMTGAPALEFGNTDAEIYGMDLAWGYYLTDRLTVNGVLTYARGKHTDVADNLYRLAPLNGRIGLTYEDEGWLASLEVIGYSSQDEVSAYNDEMSTAGYSVFNALAQWEASPQLTISASIQNLLDKRYQAHLGGVNRVTGVDIPLGERLYGVGRSVYLGASFTW